MKIKFFQGIDKVKENNFASLDLEIWIQSSFFLQHCWIILE